MVMILNLNSQFQPHGGFSNNINTIFLSKHIFVVKQLERKTNQKPEFMKPLYGRFIVDNISKNLFVLDWITGYICMTMRVKCRTKA